MKNKVKTFNTGYPLLHSTKSKMHSGVELNMLHRVKVTPKGNICSFPFKTYCGRTFKGKGMITEVNIPVVTDELVLKFLDEHCWWDWKDREIEEGNSEMLETVKYLQPLFPDKELVYFDELESIIVAYNWGTFETLDKNGQVKEPCPTRKYYTHKYNKFIDEPTINGLRDKYFAEKNEKLKKQYHKEYFHAEREYAFQYLDLTPVFSTIGRNVVCYPVAYTKKTIDADWCDYGHDGEIFFVVTENVVYFSVSRHF